MILFNAKKNIKENAYFMKNAIDVANMREVLKFASLLLRELSNSDLNPTNYHMIFMLIFDEMRKLEDCVRDEHLRGRRISDLFEIVQHCE